MRIDIYKDFLENAKIYKGGKTKAELGDQGPLLKLSSNENLLGTSPLAMRAIHETLGEVNEYPDGNPIRLNRALSEYYDHRLPPMQFVSGNSGSEILEMIIRAFLSESLECIVSSPTFMPYVIFSKKLGAKVIDIPLIKDTFALDIQAILQAVTPQTRLVFITNPNNPTGTYIDNDTMRFLLDQIPSHVIVVIDEVYRHFVDADDYNEAIDWLEEGYNIIGVNSFSKAYGLASLRSGYLYAPERIAMYIAKLVRPFHINMLSLNASIAALKDTAFIAQTQKMVREGKSYLYKEFDKLGLQYWQSQTNFILTKPKIEPDQFVKALQEKGIMVRPVANFGAPGCVRITIGQPNHNRKLVAALEQIL